MKNILFTAAILLVSQSYAQTKYQETLQNAFLSNQALYEKIMPANLRESQPKETQKSFSVHLLDSNKNFIFPELITQPRFNNKTHVTGTMTYVYLFPRKYNYDVYVTPENEIVFSVRVYFKNPKSDDFESFAQRIQNAEYIWNASRPEMDFHYRFEFKAVKSPKDAHFSVNVLDSTRGPYDTNWGRDWTATTISHEIGHMMGLGDEYETLTSKAYCLPTSLMCYSSSGSLMFHHYYFVLRRLFI